ncbi:hypothetical protein [Acetobacter sp.]|jgi:hypothetical protein|uniref:hypothetical protein n=1 Tax=Acetobacter sp. TaxID=440 RepID=UPI0025BA2CE4|nr:hypothetical protein [Acetobacter sp.]MCH4091380.1 hypothetical protein [Acetobacter sp.]MCI1299358.1 hypothetical protein [Acetobacter sp.]MCI1316638.1 hypothetical protein [Acetobacter sp.]
MPLSSEEDAYANNYIYFNDSLGTLSEDTATQCEQYGYFNVAWELKDDMLSNGHAVLFTGEAYLTLYQKQSIKMLLQKVENIPDEVVFVTNTRKNHLKAMSDPVWIPLRTEARTLLDLLQMETQRVRRLLNMDP